MNLAQKAVRGTIFVGFGNYLTYIVSFAGSVALARLLPPEFFGIIALSQFFLSFSGRIKEIGLEQALIHRQKNWEQYAANHLSLQLIFGLAIIFLNSLLAIPVGLHYGRTTGLVLFVSGLFGLLGAYSTTFTKILEKELMFKQSTLVDVAVVLISNLGMVGMAWRGFGIWALVVGGLPGAILNTFLIWRVCPVKVRPRWDREIIKWFFRFGPWWHWIFSATASLIILQFDNFLVGTLVSATVLGFYARAYNWATLPTARVAAIISRVAYPLYAKLQTSRESLSRAYNLTLSVIVRVTLPVSLVGVLIIREGTLLLVGEKWLPLVPMFQALFVYMVLRPLFDNTGALFTAIGRPRVINTIQVAQAVVVLIANPILVKLAGGVGAGLGAGAAMLVGVLLLYPKLRTVVEVRFREVFLSPLVAAGAGLLVLWVVFPHLPTEPAALGLALKPLPFLAGYFTTLLALEYRRWFGYKDFLKSALVLRK